MGTGCRGVRRCLNSRKPKSQTERMNKLIFTIALSTLFVSGCATHSSAPTVNQWEYKTLFVGKPTPENFINRYATNGWEIISIGIKDDNEWGILLRRPRQSGN
jgi:hypothetical protein